MFTFSYGVAALIAVAIFTIGILYILTPSAIAPSFGLPQTNLEEGFTPWLRLKGVRDIVSGLIIATAIACATPATLGLILAINALIPIGDMTTILAAKGSKRSAFAVHGLTAAIMLAAAAPLIAGA